MLSAGEGARIPRCQVNQDPANMMRLGLHDLQGQATEEQLTAFQRDGSRPAGIAGFCRGSNGEIHRYSEYKSPNGMMALFNEESGETHQGRLEQLGIELTATQMKALLDCKALALAISDFACKKGQCPAYDTNPPEGNIWKSVGRYVFIRTDEQKLRRMIAALEAKTGESYQEKIPDLPASKRQELIGHLRTLLKPHEAQESMVATGRELEQTRMQENQELAKAQAEQARKLQFYAIEGITLTTAEFSALQETSSLRPTDFFAEAIDSSAESQRYCFIKDYARLTAIIERLEQSDHPKKKELLTYLEDVRRDTPRSMSTRQMVITGAGILFGAFASLGGMLYFIRRMGRKQDEALRASREMHKEGLEAMRGAMDSHKETDGSNITFEKHLGEDLIGKATRELERSWGENRRIAAELEIARRSGGTAGQIQALEGQLIGARVGFESPYRDRGFVEAILDAGATGKKRGNPVLLGPSDTGKSAGMEGFAQAVALENFLREHPQASNYLMDGLPRMPARRISDSAGSVVWELDLRKFGDRSAVWFNKDEAVIAKITEWCEAQLALNHDVYLFIDEVHQAGHKDSQAIGAIRAGLMEKLKKLMERYARLHIVTATTPAEFQHELSSDPAHLNRVTPVTLGYQLPEHVVEIMQKNPALLVDGITTVEPLALQAAYILGQTTHPRPSPLNSATSLFREVVAAAVGRNATSVTLQDVLSYYNSRFKARLGEHRLDTPGSIEAAFSAHGRAIESANAALTEQVDNIFRQGNPTAGAIGTADASIGSLSPLETMLAGLEGNPLLSSLIPEGLRKTAISGAMKLFPILSTIDRIVLTAQSSGHYLGEIPAALPALVAMENETPTLGAIIPMSDIEIAAAARAAIPDFDRLTLEKQTEIVDRLRVGLASPAVVHGGHVKMLEGGKLVFTPAGVGAVLSAVGVVPQAGAIIGQFSVGTMSPQAMQAAGLAYQQRLGVVGAALQTARPGPAPQLPGRPSLPPGRQLLGR